jgi:hypothetical protein
MRKEITLQRASLIGMALGLFLIVQPWAEFLFATGFPVTLISIIGYNAAGWLTGERTEKRLAEDKKRTGAVDP